MNRRAVIPAVVVCLFAGVLGVAAPAIGASIHVSPSGGGDGGIGSPTDLQSALDAAAASAEDDVVLLQQGTYPAAETFTYATANAGALLVSGGWAADFAYQSPRYAGLTFLDGQDARRVLKIAATGGDWQVQVTLENLTVQNGYTTYTAGGDAGNGAGILATNDGGPRLFLTLRWVDVLDNVTSQYPSQGGGLYANCWLGLYSCSFRRNATHYVGGGASMDYAAPWSAGIGSRVEDSVFEANEAYDDAVKAYGGAHVFTLTAPFFKRTSFTGKPGGASSGAGGVAANYGAYPTFENCVFSGNVTDFYGGAIQFWDAGGQVRGCLFLGNRSGADGASPGGALAMYDGGSGVARLVTVANCTFVGNRSPYGAGAIHNRVQALAVANSVFWDNGTASNQGGAYALSDSSGAATLDSSDVQGGLAGTGFTGANNITVAPYTGEAWDYPYWLLADSPCVDAGDNAAVAADFVADAFGNPRVFGAGNFQVPLVDMGWHEYYDGELSLDFPTKDTIWLNDGVAKQIPWTCTKVPGDVRLSLWRGSPAEGGAEVRQIAASVPCANLSYSWKLPLTLADRDDYAVVIESLSLPALVEWNWVTTKHLLLTRPNTGNLTQGMAYAITWKSGGLPGALVKIEVYLDDKRKLLVSSGAPNTGRYAWKVPFTLAPTTGYKMRLSTASPRVAEDWSDYTFRVLPALTVTAPDGGEAWQRGTARTISWAFKNNPGTAVRLELYRAGVLDRTIAASVPIGAAGVGSYRWRIPATLAADTTYRVKVRSVAYPKVYDFSLNPFSITE